VFQLSTNHYNCSVDVLHTFFTSIPNSVNEYITSPLFPELWSVSQMRQYGNRFGRFYSNADLTRCIRKRCDVTNQTHAPKKRTGRMLRAYSFTRRDWLPTRLHALRINRSCQKKWNGTFWPGGFGLSRFGHGTFRSWSFRSRDISVRLYCKNLNMLTFQCKRA